MDRVLHVFGGPFPTYQGTQVLVRDLCNLSTAAGFEPVLACYAHGIKEIPVAFEVVRAPDVPVFRSERSGPHPRKMLLDLQLARRVRSFIASHRPSLLHAHHYEALMACVLADPGGEVPLLFHQHARFEPELPTYAPRRFAPLLRGVGRIIDRGLPGCAEGVIALHETNAAILRERGFPAVHMLPPVAPPIIAPHRPRPTTALRAVYAGNLDAYQNLSPLIAACQIAHVPLTVITASDPATFFLAGQTGDGIRVVPHGSFEAAMAELVRADVAVVPRTSCGGMPVKLINALAAGMPAIADPRVAQGLRHKEEIYWANCDDPSAIADALRALASKSLRERLSNGARNAARRYNEDAARDALARIYRATRQEGTKR